MNIKNKKRDNFLISNEKIHFDHDNLFDNSDDYLYQKVFFLTVFTVPVLPVIKTVTGNTGTDTAVPVKIGTGNDMMIR